jgi:hypothetical protein
MRKQFFQLEEKRMKGGTVILCSIALILCGLLVRVESIGTWSVESLSSPRYGMSGASVGPVAIFAGGLDANTNSLTE